MIALRLFVTTKPPPPPKGADASLWDAACRNAPYAYDGPVEGEPWIACRLAELRADLTRAHHQDAQLADAHRSGDEAALDFRSADTRADQIEAETAPVIEAGRAARRVSGDPYARNARAEGARARKRRKGAYELRDDARARAERQVLARQVATAAVTDRLHVLAMEGVARIHQYRELLNARRAQLGHAPLPVPRPDLADRLVLETCRRVGDPPTRH